MARNTGCRVTCPAWKALRHTERGRPRGPTPRSLVKLALRCQSAEELGERLKRRHERQQLRQGTARPGRGRVHRELLDLQRRIAAVRSRGGNYRYRVPTNLASLTLAGADLEPSPLEADLAALDLAE